MLKIILLILAVAIVGVLIAASFRPDSFRIERSIRIKAAPEKVFAFIDDFHRWTAWSPWEKLDPAMKRTHSGSPSGNGAVYAWEGNGKVGQGSMQIAESVPHSEILINLHFIKPMNTQSSAEFTLTPQDGDTEVKWAMYGPSPYLSKLMGLFFNMDTMIGKDFERGLADLKTAAES